MAPRQRSSRVVDGPPERRRVVVGSRLLGADVVVDVLRPEHAPAVGWLWMLHGRGASADYLGPLATRLGLAMASGLLPPLAVAVPDGPWNCGAHWWVDSTFGGRADLGLEAGRPVESALLTEVLPAVEGSFGRPHRPSPRLVAGTSMGGAAALRYLLAHPHIFAAAALLSPAAYEDRVPYGSSAEASGAFGVGAQVFRPERFGQVMGWRGLLARRPPGSPPVRVAITVGDGEPSQGAGCEPMDLDLVAAGLHAALKLRPDVTSSLRVVPGGHDRDLWQAQVVDTVLRALGPATARDPAQR